MDRTRYNHAKSIYHGRTLFDVAMFVIDDNGNTKYKHQKGLYHIIVVVIDANVNTIVANLSCPTRRATNSRFGHDQYSTATTHYVSEEYQYCRTDDISRNLLFPSIDDSGT
jgi:hypothetical protein